MAAFALCLLCLALLQTSWCQFVFELKLDDIVDLNNCYDALEVIDPTCETYLAKFCLREARDTSTRSYDLDDCPFGRAGRFGHFSALPIIKPISSSQPWPVTIIIIVSIINIPNGLIFCKLIKTCNCHLDLLFKFINLYVVL